MKEVAKGVFWDEKEINTLEGREKIINGTHAYVPIYDVIIPKEKLAKLKEKMKELGIEEITHDQFDDFIKSIGDDDGV